MQEIDRKLSAIALISREKLQHILCSIPGRKDLIIEQNLIKPLEKVCGVSWLRKQGIEKIYKLEPSVISVNSQCVYFIPSCLVTLKRVLDQIQTLINSRPSEEISEIRRQTDYNVIIMPKVLNTFSNLLEEEGLHGLVTLYSFQWELIWLDSNILSLEIPQMFKQIYIKEDSSLLSCVANSLWTLSQVAGPPKLFITLGKSAGNVLDMYNMYNNSYNNSKKNSDIGAIIVMDRDQDYASTLMTPVTYSSLLNEIFTLNCGTLELNAATPKISTGQLNVGQETKLPTQTKSFINLNSSVDEIYCDIKYRHFSTIFSLLCSQAKALNMEGNSSKNLNLVEMKKFVATKLQQVTAKKRDLANHLLACETIVSHLGNVFEVLKNSEQNMINNRNKKSLMTFLEETLCTNIHKQTSLRLICLLSLTLGLSYSEYCSLSTKYLHAFGYNYLHVFQNLSTAGLFIQPTQTRISMSIPNLSTIGANLPKWQSTFQTNANKLKQIPSENEPVDLKDPTCPSYVFNGSYIPLIAQIASLIIKTDSFMQFSTKMNAFSNLKVGGTALDELRIDLNGAKLNNNIDLKAIMAAMKAGTIKDNLLPIIPRSILIFVIGGVTYAEIAACNLIEQLTGVRIFVASNCIISGNDLMDAALDVN